MSGACSLPGCGRPRKGLGYCNAHYIRLRKYGNPLGGKPVMHGEPMAFMRNVVLPHSGNDCLVWPYYRNADGYGQVRFNGRDMGAHRVACILANGEPPTDGHEAAHNCGNGRGGCVSPKHLRWATMLENEADKFKHGSLKYGEKHHSSKLTAQQVAEIKSLKGAKTAREIGVEFGVSMKTVYRAQNDNLWNMERAG